MDDLLDHYKEVLGSEEAAIRRLCMKFDIYWNPKIYATLRNGCTNSRIKTYLSRCNLSVYVGKTYDDTLDEEALAQEAQAELEADMAAEEEAAKEAEALQPEPITEEIPVVQPVVIEEAYDMPDQEIVRFWGAGLTPDYYFSLQDRFDKWTANLPKPLDQGSESLYRQVCICEEQIMRGIAAGAPVDKPQNTLNTLLGSLNEKPTQKKQDEALDADFEKMTFGMGIKAFENTRPIPKPDPEFEDVDGIRRYISTWFFGHLCSMLNIKNSYCRLYEEEMARLRVERPDLAEEDDDSVIAADIFGEEVI